MQIGGQIAVLSGFSSGGTIPDVFEGRAFIGGKRILDLGLTLDGQLGGQMLLSSEGFTPGLLINLNVGWSI